MKEARPLLEEGFMEGLGTLDDLDMFDLRSLQRVSS